MFLVVSGTLILLFPAPGRREPQLAYTAGLGGGDEGEGEAGAAGGGYDLGGAGSIGSGSSSKPMASELECQPLTAASAFSRGYRA